MWKVEKFMNRFELKLFFPRWSHFGSRRFDRSQLTAWFQRPKNTAAGVSSRPYHLKRVAARTFDSHRIQQLITITYLHKVKEIQRSNSELMNGKKKKNDEKNVFNDR